MKIGIYGGTFNPVHYGHLLLAETCREQMKLDEVWFVPAGDPPHKSDDIATGRARAEMLDFAVSGIPEYSVNRMELRREGPSFTVETLQELREAHPDHEFCFLMGADSLVDLPGWREPETICQLATVVAVNRGADPTDDEQTLNTLGDLAGRVAHVTMPGVDYSSTVIRERIRNQQSVRFRIPKAVECYIRENNVYA